MFGKVPAYTDISHFRAPYKNAYIAGFGGNQMYGYGDAPPTPPTPPPPPAAPTAPSLDMYVETDKRGYRFVKKDLRPMLEAVLKSYSAIYITPTRIAITPVTLAEKEHAGKDPNYAKELANRSAWKWVNDHVKAGNVAFMTTVGLAALMSGSELTHGANEIGTFKAATEQARTAAKSPLGVVVGGDPDGEGALAGMEPWHMALIAAGVVGGVVLIARMRKGRGRRGGGRSMTM